MKVAGKDQRGRLPISLILAVVGIGLISAGLAFWPLVVGRYVCLDYFLATEGEGDSYADALDKLQSANPKFSPQWVPDGSRIVFAASGRSVPSGQIFVVASDGASMSLAAAGKSETYYRIVHSLSVSPDGSRVAYSASAYRSYLIETSTMDGLDRRTLTEGNVIDFDPEWSPSGSRIAFVRRYDRDACGEFHRVGIYTVGYNGQDIRKVVDIRSRIRQGTTTEWDVSGPKWSPDGELLAYVVNEIEEEVEEKPEFSGRDYYYRDQTVLYTVNADGSDIRKLLTFSQRGKLATSDQTYVTSDEDLKRVGLFSDEPARSIMSPPEWSPDGQQMAFVGVAEGVPKLYTIGRDGSDLREVIELPDQAGGPGNAFWSRDGLRIMFSQGRTLYSVNADGSDLHSVHGGDYFSPAPNEARIAHFVNHLVVYGSNVVLYTTAPDGSDARLLARRRDDGELEAVGPGDRPSVDVSSCFVGVVVPDPESNSELVRDCEALVRMIDRIAAVGLNWNSDVPIAEWEGVTVGEPPRDDSSSSASYSKLRVLGLSLPNRGLVGTVSPDELAKLTALGILNFRNNEYLIRCVPLSLRGQLKGIQRLGYCDQ